MPEPVEQKPKPEPTEAETVWSQARKVLDQMLPASTARSNVIQPLRAVEWARARLSEQIERALEEVTGRGGTRCCTRWPDDGDKSRPAATPTALPENTGTPPAPW